MISQSTRGYRPSVSCTHSSCTVSSFFFFQAEDGIRDIGVTGVQTCALPICGRSEPGCWPHSSNLRRERLEAQKGPDPGIHLFRRPVRLPDELDVNRADPFQDRKSVV